MGAGGLLAGLALLVAGGVAMWVAWEGSQGRLRPGHPLGVRARSTLAGDDAWRAGHRAAAAPLGVGAGVVAGAGLAVLAVGTGDVIGWVVVGVGVLALVTAVALAVRAAVDAARATRP